MAGAPQIGASGRDGSNVRRKRALAFAWLVFALAWLLALRPVAWGNKSGSLQFDFRGMLPGDWKSATISATNVGAAPEDIYLVFTNANGTWSAVNDLGTYAEADINGVTYTNLNNRFPQNAPGPAGQLDACGDPQGASHYLPHVNYLGTLNPGQKTTYTFKFRFTKCLSSSALQGMPLFANALEYDVAAYQSGVSPGDPRNGAGMISDLPLAPNHNE